MSSSAQIGNWSTGLWLSLGSPANVSALTISGFATSPNTIGFLNTRLSLCFSGSGFTGYPSFDYDVVPDYSQSDMNIIGCFYLVGYWNALAAASMGAGGVNTPWQSLREGDSVVTRGNVAAIGKVYADLAKTANDQLNYEINSYVRFVQGGETPRQVAWASIVNPTWGGPYGGPTSF